MLMHADKSESPLTFPKKADKARLAGYDYGDKLYFGDHFDAFAIKGEADFTNAYNRLRYVVANFAGLCSRVMADMLFNEPLTLDFKDKKNQQWADGMMADNQLQTQFYESALANSRRGDSLFKIRIGQRNPGNPADPSTVIIEEVTPAIFFPKFDNGLGRYQTSEDVLAWVFYESEKCYLHKEIHRPGYIFHEIYRYDPDKEKIISQENVTDFGFEATEVTKVKRSLIFHVPNVRDGKGYFGTSDYRDLDKLFFALNNRITKIDNILDKHSDPILAVPPGVLDEDGKVRKDALGMVEVDNETGAKPEYIVWDANLEAAFKEIDKLVDFLFMFSEIAPDTMGMGKDSKSAESGRALKFRLLSTIRKRNRKKLYYDQAIKDIMETAQELAIAWSISVDGISITKPERPAIKWPDGVINDETETIENHGKRLEQGTMSKADSIAELDGIPIEDAKKKVKEIEAETAIDLPLTGDPNLPANANKGGQPNPAPNTPAKKPAPAGV